MSLTQDAQALLDRLGLNDLPTAERVGYNHFTIEGKAYAAQRSEMTSVALRDELRKLASALLAVQDEEDARDPLVLAALREVGRDPYFDYEEAKRLIDSLDAVRAATADTEAGDRS
jgi:hypothetical protein